MVTRELEELCRQRRTELRNLPELVAENLVGIRLGVAVILSANFFRVAPQFRQ